MSLAAKFRRAPLRIVAGAYLLNAGISKFSAPDDVAKSQHDMASGAFPPLEKIPPNVYVKAVGAGETALGAALLLPFFSPFLVGAGLTAFAGGLVGMYWRTPGLHQEGNPRPTAQGMPYAKDVWLAGIGAALVVDAIVTPIRDGSLRARTKGRAVLKAETKAARKSARRAAKRAATYAPSVDL